MSRVAKVIQITVNSVASSTALQTACAALGPNQSASFGTISGSILRYGSEGANFIQWGNSLVYDPTRKEVTFIGKRDSVYPYHWLLYDETTGTWSNSRLVWSTSGVSGHGYDHNAIDPATGTLYHKAYGDPAVHVWNGSWSTLPAIPTSIIIGGLTWFPGVGLMYNDGSKLCRYSGGAWSTIQSFGGDTYDDFSEYNSTANVLIFSANNSYYKMTAGLAVSAIAAPPFKISVSKNTGLAVSDPRGAYIIAYNRASPYQWARYDINANSWASIPSGYPSIPTDADQWVIGGEIPLNAGQYGAMLFVKYTEGAANGTAYLYRYS